MKGKNIPLRNYASARLSASLLERLSGTNLTKIDRGRLFQLNASHRSQRARIGTSFSPVSHPPTPSFLRSSTLPTHSQMEIEESMSSASVSAFLIRPRLGVFFKRVREGDVKFMSPVTGIHGG